jgi:hypothetical protein
MPSVDEQPARVVAARPVTTISDVITSLQNMDNILPSDDGLWRAYGAGPQALLDTIEARWLTTYLPDGTALSVRR